MSFAHGVTITEVPTRIAPAAPVDSALPFVVGTAPVQGLAAQNRPINVPVLVETYEEFVARFGDVPDGQAESSYSLSQFAKIYFGLYGAAPIVCVNVFNPATHVTTGGSPTPDVTKVVAADVVGGVTGGGRKGIELVEMVFPLFGKIPSAILAPGFSKLATVAAALDAKAGTLINGLWRTQALVDIADAEADPVAWKGQHCAGAHTFAVYGSLVASDGSTHPASAHVAGLLAVGDLANGGLPFVSPSNQPYKGIARATTPLTKPEADTLNAAGVATSLRIGPGALRLWGNRTAAYPEVTDVKDSFLPTRRMTSYLLNLVGLSLLRRVDGPLNGRLIQGAADELNILLTQMVGSESLAGGRAEVFAADNPPLALMDGKVKIRLYFAPITPAEEIAVVAEVDVNYYESLVA